MFSLLKVNKTKVILYIVLSINVFLLFFNLLRSESALADVLNNVRLVLGVVAFSLCLNLKKENKHK